MPGGIIAAQDSTASAGESGRKAIFIREWVSFQAPQSIIT
jgi:hypothetical protein